MGKSRWVHGNRSISLLSILAFSLDTADCGRGTDTMKIHCSTGIARVRPRAIRSWHPRPARPTRSSSAIAAWGVGGRVTLPVSAVVDGGNLSTFLAHLLPAPPAALLPPLALQVQWWWGLAPVWATDWVVKVVHAMVRWWGLLF